MANGWRKARMALQQHMCLTSTLETDDALTRSSDAGYQSTEVSRVSMSDTASALSPANFTPTRSPSRLHLLRSFRFSRCTCAICLEVMKPGLGRALFTAECSHTFHFLCIAASVRHGNLICPVCRAKWNEVPWQAPQQAPKYLKGAARSPRSNTLSPGVSVQHGSNGNGTLEVEEEVQRLDPVLRILDESIARARGIRRSNSPEPNIFNDDEPLISETDARKHIQPTCAINFPAQDLATEVLETGVVETGGASSSALAIAESEQDEGESVSNLAPHEGSTDFELELRCCAELESVLYSAELESFTVLVHVKAANRKLKHQNYEVVSNVQRNRNMTGPHCHTMNFNVTSSSLDVSPQILDPSKRAPIDLVTVLDVSGSMAGTKLVLLKRAMDFVIHNLSSADRLSIVVFNSTARRVFPLRKMVGGGKQLALRAIDALIATGGTNIAEGLRKGAKVLDERQDHNPVSSIMLLSDGQDTYSMGIRGQLPLSGSCGRADYHYLVPESLRGTTQNGQMRIPVHAFGFGADHDAVIMHSISQLSGGTFSFIQTEGAVQDAFAQCIGGLLSVVVQEAQLFISVELEGATLKSIQAGTYETHLDDQGTFGSVKLGDLYAEEERDILLEIKLPTLDMPHDEERPVIRVKSKYKNPVSNECKATLEHALSITRPSCVGDGHTVNIEVDRQRNRIQTAQAISEAGSLADAGDISGARKVLRGAKMALRRSAAFLAVDHLSIALDNELDEIQARMANRQAYERSGRAYALSAQSSHFQQRATTRGDSVEGQSRDYQTPSMVDMVFRSQTMSLPNLTSTRSIPASCEIQPVLGDMFANTSPRMMLHPADRLHALSSPRDRLHIGL